MSVEPFFPLLIFHFGDQTKICITHQAPLVNPKKKMCPMDYIKLYYVDFSTMKISLPGILTTSPQ